MAAPEKNDRFKLAVAGMGLTAALLLAAWLLGYFERDDLLSDDPQVAELQRAMQQPGKTGETLLKQKYQQLAPQQRREFDDRKMLMFLPEQEQVLRDFFARPPQEQWEQIDREIDGMEAKRRQYAIPTSPKGNKLVGGNADPQQIMSMKKEWTAHASPELRSLMTRRIQMLNERREQRGLEPL